MKARILVLLCLIVAVAAVAQTAPPSQRVAPDKPKAATTTAAPAKPMAMPAKPMTTQAKPMATPAAAPKPMTAAKKAPAKKPVATAAVKAPAKAPGKRDPFISPVREGGGPAGPDCTVGKKCLAIDSILLRGIVRAPSGSIAVVESSTRKVTYFLRESDPVFNGYVVKITADSVMFRENVMDRLGKQSTRDVVKRVSAPPV